MHTAPTPPASDDRGVRPEPPNVREQLLLLWRSRMLIGGLALTLGAGGAVFSLVRSRQFEASATVSVSGSRLAEQTPGRVPPESFVPLMATQAVAAKVIAEVPLAGVTPTGLLNRIITVRSVPDSSFIKVVARLNDPALAARTANSFATHGVEAATRAGQIDVDAIQAELKRMLDEATERLRAAEKAYDDYRVSARVEMLEREVDTLVNQRGELMDVLVELAGEKARLARLDGELGKRERVTSLRQSIVDDPALAEAARNAAPASRDLLGVQMTRETSNSVFENLDEEAAKTRARVAFLEEQRLRFGQAAGLNGAQLSKLTQLYESESALARLETERLLARNSYEAVAQKYQGARLAAVGRTPQLLIVDPAIPPDDPLSRYTARNVLLGLTVGALFGCILVMLRHALAEPARG